MDSKIFNLMIFLIIVSIISIDLIKCETKKERFKFDEKDGAISGTDIQKGFKAGYFGVKKASDKDAYASGAARCAGEPTTKKILKEWDKEDDGPYKEAGIACHKAGKDWSENAKQAFVAGSSVGATGSLLKKGVTKIKLKEAPQKEE